MGTRAVIAKPAGDGWVGRYHHWDGYPAGLGETLVAWHEKIGPERLIEILVDGEKVGWSTINGADLGLPKTWNDEELPAEHGPLSYSARGETDEWLITHDGEDGGTEWAYVITSAGVTVFERRFGRGESEDQGHGTGAFGFGASDTEHGGYWLLIGTVKSGDEEAMRQLDPSYEPAEA